MTGQKLKLSALPGELAVCRLDKDGPLPDWIDNKNFYSITKTADELSIVCSAGKVPQDVKSEKGWRALKIEGPLDFSLTGIVSSLTAPLAKAGISVFVISTFDTDYILVKSENLEKTLSLLEEAGLAEII